VIDLGKRFPRQEANEWLEQQLKGSLVHELQGIKKDQIGGRSASVEQRTPLRGVDPTFEMSSASGRGRQLMSSGSSPGGPRTLSQPPKER